MQPVSNLKQSRVNRILGRTGVRLWALFVLGALLSIGIVTLILVALMCYLLIRVVQRSR